MLNLLSLNPFRYGVLDQRISMGGAHWALEHWYVTLQPKWVISEPNGPKIIQFDTKSDHSSYKNVSKIYILYLRDFL